jgi:hypothetical protein
MRNPNVIVDNSYCRIARDPGVSGIDSHMPTSRYQYGQFLEARFGIVSCLPTIPESARSELTHAGDCRL